MPRFPTPMKPSLTLSPAFRDDWMEGDPSAEDAIVNPPAIAAEPFKKFLRDVAVPVCFFILTSPGICSLTQSFPPAWTLPKLDLTMPNCHWSALTPLSVVYVFDVVPSSMSSSRM